MTIALALLLVLLAPGMAPGEPQQRQGRPGEEIVALRWRFLAGGGGAHWFKTGIDGGGHVSVSEAELGVGGRARLSRALSLRIHLGYEYALYDFSGSRGLGGLDPWDDVHRLGLSSTLAMRFSERWRGYAGFRARAAGESGADFGDAITTGGLAGASYRVNDRLTVGAGVTVDQRLEDPPSVSPLLSVVWSITDDLTLRVGSVGGPGEGAGGAELEWQALPELELAVGVRNQVREFRLDARGVAPEGVGRDRSRPVHARASWKLAHHIALTAQGGAAVMGRLEVEDRRGRELHDEDHDPTPFVSLRLTVGF